MLQQSSKAEVVVALSAATWGLFWIPLRFLERQGLDPTWITLSQFLAPIICLLPFAIYRVINHQSIGLSQVLTGLLIGSAFALYCYSLLLTDVVRALILFYIMPAWGTIIEVAFMGRSFTRWRVLALILSISGLLVIVAVDASLSFSSALNFNSGDIMALFSGIVFTIGATRVRLAPEVSVFEQIFSFFFFGGMIAIIFLLLQSDIASTLPDSSVIISVVPWLLLLAPLYLIPVMWGLYWGSRFVDPGRLGLLLQLEVVVGIFSAALLAGEVFGWREAIGTALVISAGIVEVFANKNTALETA